jgi:hypothetical protein
MVGGTEKAYFTNCCVKLIPEVTKCHFSKFRQVPKLCIQNTYGGTLRMHILFKIYVVWSCCEITYILHIRGSFFAHIQTGPGTHPASRTMGTGSFPVVKRLGRGADHPPPSSAEVENE